MILFAKWLKTLFKVLVYISIMCLLMYFCHILKTIDKGKCSTVLTFLSLQRAQVFDYTVFDYILGDLKKLVSSLVSIFYLENISL